jgi:hypothetical protein
MCIVIGEIAANHWRAQKILPGAAEFAANAVWTLAESNRPSTTPRWNIAAAMEFAETSTADPWNHG